jgi:hypothetical protein
VISMDKWHDMLSSYQTMCLLNGIRRRKALGAWRIGTTFSGSDMVTDTLRALVEYWRERYGVLLEWEHCYNCEKDEEKQAFLMQTSGCAKLYRSMEELCQTQAYELKSGTLQIVPPVSLWEQAFRA